MNVVLAAVLQELEAAIAVCDRRATFIHVLYSDSTITLIPLPCLGNGANQTTESPGPPADSGPPAVRREVRPESDTERAILEVMKNTERGLKARSIATRADLNFGSYLRGVLAEMVRDGRLEKLPQGGYWLAGRPRPAPQD